MYDISSLPTTSSITSLLTLAYISLSIIGNEWVVVLRDLHARVDT